MRIYFIRHGEAEPFAKRDFDRHLTTAGRIKLHKSFSTFAKTIKGLGEYKIYSSPLVRANETAEILAEYLKKDVEIKEYLAGSYIDEVLEDLKEDENYILVGHEPYISMWIRELTGENVIVSRGSINLVELDLKEKKGRLFKNIS